MYKVYIADDEEVVRQGLKMILDWNELGFEICGEANNGLTAYHDIRILKPDLIMIDIRMPKLQGLELVHKLRDDGYLGRVIVLSGYSEFKYAQEAIQYDVDYYLTKPLDEVELRAAVINIRSILQKSALHTEHINYYQEKAKYKILEDMIKTESKSLATIEYSLGELNLEADLYQILILQSIEDGFNSYEDLCHSLKVPYKTNSIERLIEQQHEVILLKGELIVSRFMEYREKHFMDRGREYFIAAGNVVTGINDIYYSYHEALAIFERRFFFRHEKFIAIQTDLPQTRVLSESFSAKDSKEYGQKIYDLLILYKKKESKIVLDELLENLSYSKNSAESVKSFLAGMYIYIVQEFKKDYSSYNLQFQTSAEIIQWMHSRIYLRDIIAFIGQEVERMIQQISDFNSDGIVDEIVEYIKYHYTEDIKLKTLAPKFGYNSSYLGKIFSKKHGISFNDYLHQVRTEKAKKLLLDKKYKVYEVSDMIGYKNVDYFHLKFKQFIGCTPNEYRIENNIEP